MKLYYIDIEKIWREIENGLESGLSENQIIAKVSENHDLFTINGLKRFFKKNGNKGNGTLLKQAAKQGYIVVVPDSSKENLRVFKVVLGDNQALLVYNIKTKKVVDKLVAHSKI